MKNTSRGTFPAQIYLMQEYSIYLGGTMGVPKGLLFGLGKNYLWKIAIVMTGDDPSRGGLFIWRGAKPRPEKEQAAIGGSECIDAIQPRIKQLIWRLVARYLSRQCASPVGYVGNVLWIVTMDILLLLLQVHFTMRQEFNL